VATNFKVAVPFNKFFAFKNEINNTTTSTTNNTNTNTNMKNTTPYNPNSSINNIAQHFICEECKEHILESEKLNHMDMHFAQQIQKQEEIPNNTEKIIPKSKPKTPSPSKSKQKNNKKQKSDSNHKIEHFFKSK
jgi:hypothetical protein